MSNEKELITRAYKIWERQEKGFEKTRRDHPELYKTMGSEVNQRLEELKSMKKAELLQRACELEKEVWWLNLKYQSVMSWSVSIIIKELVRKRLIHSQGAVTTKQRKDDLWAHREERYRYFRAEGYKKTDACRKIKREEEERGKRVDLKTLMRKLKD